MQITYEWSQCFHPDELRELFRSLEWSSGLYPEALAQAMRGSDSVYSARADGKLVGLINALSDGVMTVYFHYLLVKPEYQGCGIGRQLVTGMMNRYSSHYRLVLNSYESAAGFYEKCGFERGLGVPMGMTNWN